MVTYNGMLNYCPGRVPLKDREAVLKVCSGAQVLAPRVPTYYSMMRRWPIMIVLGGECFNIKPRALFSHLPSTFQLFRL